MAQIVETIPAMGNTLSVDSNIHSKNGTKNSIFEVNLGKSIVNRNLSGRIALISGHMYNSVFNVSFELKNNLFEYSSDNGSTWTQVTIPNGRYNVSSLNAWIGGITTNNISVQPNFTTGRNYITLVGAYQVQFGGTDPDGRKAGLANWLGFDTITVVASTYGSKIADVNSGVNSYEIHVENLNGGSFGQSGGNVIHTFVPRTASFSSIWLEPVKSMYFQINETTIETLKVRITDNKGNELDFNGEAVTLHFHYISA